MTDTHPTGEATSASIRRRAMDRGWKTGPGIGELPVRGPAAGAVPGRPHRRLVRSRVPADGPMSGRRPAAEAAGHPSDAPVAGPGDGRASCPGPLRLASRPATGAPGACRAGAPGRRPAGLRDRAPSRWRTARSGSPAPPRGGAPAASGTRATPSLGMATGRARRASVRLDGTGRRVRRPASGHGVPVPRPPAIGRFREPGWKCSACPTATPPRTSPPPPG